MLDLPSAFRLGLALASAQLAGPANDAGAAAVSRDPSPSDDRSGLLYVERSRALPSARITAAFGGACSASVPRGDTCVVARASEALLADLRATGTHSGSRAGRLAVRVIAGALQSAGFPASADRVG